MNYKTKQNQNQHPKQNQKQITHESNNLSMLQTERKSH